MSGIAKKLICSLALTIPSAALSFVLREVFQAWGIFDPFSEWLGGWLKVHITPAQVEWTIAGIVALLAYAALLWIVWRYHRISPFTDLSTHIPEPQRDIIGGNLQPESMQQIGSNDLQIIIGSGNNYETTTESDNQNRVIRSVLVGVKNRNLNRYISNCKLYVKLPKQGNFRPLHDGSFTLNQGEEKFFSVAYRHEYIVRNEGVNDSIQFSIPYHGGAFLSDGPTHSVPRGTYFITLKATAFEARPYEIICKLWVDENGRLRLDMA